MGELKYKRQFLPRPGVSAQPCLSPTRPSPPTLTRVARQLDPRVVFSEGDHEGRILQHCLQLLPRFVLCGAERVGSGLRPGMEGDGAAAMRGNQGGPGVLRGASWDPWAQAGCSEQSSLTCAITNSPEASAKAEKSLYLSRRHHFVSVSLCPSRRSRDRLGCVAVTSNSQIVPRHIYIKKVVPGKMIKAGVDGGRTTERDRNRDR